ncbi:MAG: AAA family ATPase, partial [Clostridia bacterium]|nr:AAA family ATPase [Clostridia bacterium]
LTGDLVGLKNEREKLRGIIDMLRLETRRERFGYGRVSNGCNIVFAGPPGTAKTTLARQFARALSEMGLIEDDENFKECKKSDIIGAYVGWTAKQVDMMFHSISKKGGGVIFFDEIYTLTDSKTDYDKEAITCITQNMENYRDKVFCIFAGYGDKMDEFLSANPGLRSRIQFNIKFGDYDNETLYEIFCSMAKGNGFEIKGECRETVVDFFARLKRSRGEQFGNGREARNLFTNAVQKMAHRLGDRTDTTRDDLTTLTGEDIRLATEDILSSEIGKTDKKSGRIGFAA